MPADLLVLSNGHALAFCDEFDYPLPMSTKEILRDVSERLPADATLADAIYELEFRQAVEQGLTELDRGEGIPLDQVKARIAQWAGK